MSVIKPFTACIPDMDWLNGFKNDPMVRIQGLLEPRKDSGLLRPERHLDSMETLRHSKLYQDSDSAAIYLYEQESESGSQFGIWALTSLEDMVSGKIITHENTLPEHCERIRSYRCAVGLEGKPVLLSYERDEVICKLAEGVAAMNPDFRFSQAEVNHRLWAITDTAVLDVLQKAFGKIDRVYVADGHHRLAAAAIQHIHSPQWISTLYITTGQLRCREFHRVVLPAKKVSEIHFLNYLQGYGRTSEIPGNEPYRPEKPGQLGISLNGKWYWFDHDPALHKQERIPDVCFLQDEILEPFFGIRDPKTDKRLQCWPADRWSELLEYQQQHLQSVVFTLCAISPASLIEIAGRKIPLPPKSTYTEPKIPYGLLIYDHKKGI